MDDKLTYDFINQLTRIVNKFNELEKLPFDFGTGELLYPSEIHIIDVIGQKSDITITAISTRFGITKGAVSQVINKLCKKGYLIKTRRVDNGKEMDLSLTVKGDKAFQAHSEMHRLMDADILDLVGSFPKEWLEYFCIVIEQVENHIDKYLYLAKQR